MTNENCKHKHIFAYIIILVMVLVMSWEQAYSQPLIWQTKQLPADAIRLRVLPNSDHPVDQWLKLQVRDQVTEQMQQWTMSLSNSSEAEQLLRQQLPTIEKLAKDTITKNGFNYPVQVTFGNTNFPTVQYGEHIYPAGEYKAVLIEIGEATGQNWWCVLYPPLCLIDIATAKVSDDSTETNKSNKISDNNKTSEPKVEFFFVKAIKNILK